jgi:integrase
LEERVSAKVLTDAAVRKYAPHRKRREIPDARAAGLHLVVQPTGAKSWALRFRRPDGRPAKLTLGPVDFSGSELNGAPILGQPLTLAAARLLAADVHRQRKMGRDVIAEHAATKRRERVERDQINGSTFGTLVRQFIDEHTVPKKGRKPRRWRETARVLGLVYPLNGGKPSESLDGLAQRWRDKPVSEIDAHHVYQAVDEARRRGIAGINPRTKGLSDPRGRSMARALSVFFGWCLTHRKITVDPTVGTYCPAPPAARERTLSEDEIRWFWAACDHVGAPFGPMAKLLLLTGVRREEARAVTRAELSDDGTGWIIPRNRTKNERPHVVPLSTLARQIIAALPHIESEAGYLFTIDGRRPIAGIAKCKARLDAAMLAAAREERGKDVVLEPWRLHDLRRTAASGLQRLGIRVEVIEKCLNHISGSFAGIAGVYQRDPMIEDRRAALERWARFVPMVSDANLHIAHKKFVESGDERKKVFNDAIAEGGEPWERYLRMLATGGNHDNVINLTHKGRRS